VLSLSVAWMHAAPCRPYGATASRTVGPRARMPLASCRPCMAAPSSRPTSAHREHHSPKPLTSEDLQTYLDMHGIRAQLVRNSRISS
jgi:hypothetical protein